MIDDPSTLTHTYPQDAPDFFPQALHIFRGQAQVRPEFAKKRQGQSLLEGIKMVATVGLCSVQMKQMSNEKKTWLFGVYRGLYYPVI